MNAQLRGLDATFEPDVLRHDAGIDLGIVRLIELTDAPDPLAESIALRQCNRSRYEIGPLPVGLVRGLEELGNLLLPPHPADLLVRRASILSWRDRRFVSDLTDWTRFDTVSPDGMTLDCLRVSRVDEVWLHLALRLGRLPAWLAWFYAERDVRLTRASAAMAVLTIADRSPEALLDVGRRLIRSWTLINSLGYAWHPMSVVIDQSTVTELTEQIGGRDPVAIYRVGRPTAAAAWSNRRSLDAIVVPRPG